MDAARLLLAAGLVLPAALAVADQLVMVGSISEPTSLLAPIHFQLEKGDEVIFIWRPHGANLSVVQSSATAPCAPNPAGFRSEFVQAVRNKDTPPFEVLIEQDDMPIFFCVVDGNATAEQRCVEGTYGSINATTAQLDDFNRLAASLTSFPLQSTPSPTATKSTRSGSGANPTRTGSPGGNQREDGRGGLSAGTIAAIVAVSILLSGALFWLLRRRTTRHRRRAEHEPTRDSIIDPPPAYEAVQPASISAGAQMSEVWEHVGGRTIMRAASQPRTDGTSTSAAQTSEPPANPFASPEDDDSETATLRASSRPTSPSFSEEDAPST